MCTRVMMAFLSLSRRARCARMAAQRSMLDTTSPETSTKSLLIMSLTSISRSASPADLQLVDTMTCAMHHRSGFACVKVQACDPRHACMHAGCRLKHAETVTMP